MAKFTHSELKQIIKEEFLRVIQISTLKEEKSKIQKQLDEVRLYDSEESYDFGSYLSIKRNDETGLLNFDFAPPGWNFDTTDVAEAAAIIKGSQYKSDPKLKEIQLTDADKSNVDPEQSLYWITGGNREWKFGDTYNNSWDNSYKIFVDVFGGIVKSIVMSSNNLGELIEKLESGIAMEDVYELAADKGLINYEDEEVDSDIEPSQSLDEAKKFWQKEVKIKKGKMHQELGIPEDKEITDIYTSGEKLANALIKKVGRGKASKMINYAANASKTDNVFDKAQRWLSTNPEK